MSQTKLTAEQLIEKFPDMACMEDSLLQDLACPNCGERDSFKIGFTGTCRVDRYGSDDCGDHEWDAKSHCHCPVCDHVATVGEFTFKGLDELLYDTE